MADIVIMSESSTEEIVSSPVTENLTQACENKVALLAESIVPGTYEAARARLRRPGLIIQLAIKRLFDIVGSLFLIVILGPILIGSTLAVALSSKGPIFFRQKRWALDEGTFICLKFRSMYTEQHKILHQGTVTELQNKGVLLKVEKDPRVTPVGKFIRKSSIDELPQLYNVLMGHMSMVGPRPLVTYMLDPFPELRKVRCLMRPGITGLWQINDRENNQSALQMQPYDVRYVQEFNLWMDLVLLIKTPIVVMRGGGAH
jgi:exopolysaccharide production protein ExoY